MANIYIGRNIANEIGKIQINSNYIGRQIKQENIKLECHQKYMS